MTVRIFLLFLFATIVGIGTVYWQKQQDYAEFTERLSQLGGLRLNTSRTEVRYELGDPTHVALRAGDQLIDIREEPAEHPVDAYHVWAWEDDEMFAQASFDPFGRVAEMACFTKVQIANGWWCATVGGVSTTGPTELDYLVDSLEVNVVSELGQPDRITYQKDDGPIVKIADYTELGIRLSFISERLERIEKTSRVPSFWWWLRDGPTLYGT